MEAVWWVLEKKGIPSKYIKVIKDVQSSSNECVNNIRGTSAFPIMLDLTKT